VSEVDRPSGQGQNGPKRSPGETARLVGIIALIVYGVIVILLNGNKATIHLLFWSVDMPLWIALLLFAAIGFALGWLLSHLNRRRNK
jgi:uncharacterized integral membrane protein